MLSAREWPKYGVTAEILSTGITTGEYAPTLQQAGWRVHHLPFRKSPGFFFELAGFLRREGYDAVHIHAERAFPYFALTAKAAGIPRIVRTIHNAFPFSGGLRRRRTLQRKLMARMGVVSTSVSRSVQQHEREHFRNETVYVPNWYDSAHFVPPSDAQRLAARQEIGVIDDQFVLVSVSNCAPAKNHMGILAALAMLPSDLNFRYFHVGRGLQESAEREFVSRNRLTEKVVFSGQQSEVRKFLWAADCFLMPSLYEGIPIAGIEALGSATTTLMSAAPGLQDFRQYCQGISWTGTSPKEIYEGIIKIRNIPQRQRRDVSISDAAAIKESFSMPHSLQAFIKLYAKVS
ncbi:glycosyltransferase involved in cell wall biosynthesis [Acidipila rosea]|uniref:Glycosyltransferase involved in cell wall biosynthesis n=2 Tax=Acidipila rosea TaxID=768535 RepID=A0A4R1L1Y9_9BACT|nr:glycosyltransferase involved in cell wall biosynthesis [Acidipila rosea]